ncbi:alpha/beta hydrolase [Hyphomonas polymorpha PS728]|uniref:Alpha/beta hydrolase n=1 Tax=Hyphomonas polymorpha PS728 TaxID=1280954 RepID=A0A062VMQ9_9PROT|nr:alpha/beta hydrolase fold domain-containing protein [Hyphomonas polymorpha]KCZ99452.1 alpha/beta hydrolase [Hyphomonas polymorpha PS728]
MKVLFLERHMPAWRLLRPLVASCAGLLAACTHQPLPPPPETSTQVSVDPDGLVHVPAMLVPVSEYLSPEGKAYLIDHLLTMKNPELLKEVEGIGGPAFLKGYIDRQRELFAVQKSETEIGGVQVYDYTPSEGIKPENQNRVLINLHGGGFITCWPACAEVESMPVSALGGYRVVAVNYRQAPEYKFPAASEDVAAVYTELLKTYPAENIGIFGCSAGGMLTGMSLAWFQKHNLPTPGAAGIYCAGSAAPVNGFGGDANYTATAIGEARFIAPLRPTASASDAPKRSMMPYLSEVDPYDPLVAPAHHDEILAAFPPTQIITGTRGFELSSAVYTHSRLVKLGVKADLHVWEGMFHGFYSNPDVPESQDAYKVMVDFFDEHLGN